MEQLVTTPFITSFFTTWRASLSDNLEGAAFARTNAKIGVCAGLAIVAGPLMSKAIMSRADPKYVVVVLFVLCPMVSVGPVGVQENICIDKKCATSFLVSILL